MTGIVILAVIIVLLIVAVRKLRKSDWPDNMLPLLLLLLIVGCHSKPQQVPVPKPMPAQIKYTDSLEKANQLALRKRDSAVRVHNALSGIQDSMVKITVKLLHCNPDAMHYYTEYALHRNPKDLKMLEKAGTDSKRWMNISNKLSDSADLIRAGKSTINK